MPWYLPWSEGIKKRACRYLLQRYLGQFLEEKLTLDQLTVDLYNGIGSVFGVKLDVHALNELGEQQNLPVEFVDGYISEMSVSIPWASLLKDSSYVEVKGLTLTIQPKQRADTGASMFESVWSSMSSSMQLAEECLRDGELEAEDSPSQPLEGLELFAQAIDSILCRVKVKFLDTRVRLEHVPKGSATGVALELRVHIMDYFDECGSESLDSEVESPPSAEHGRSQRLYQVAAFACKAFHLEGVELLADEFPVQARTFSRSVMSLSTMSSPGYRAGDGALDSPISVEGVFESPDSMASSRHSECSTESYAAASGERGQGSNVLLEPEPVALGRLTGRQEVRLRLRQQENAPGPKVQLEAQCGALLLFLSPRQVHLLRELVGGLAQPHLQDTSNVPVRPSRPQEKPMGVSDFRRVEQELQQQLCPPVGVRSVGVRSSQGWSTATLGESEEEEEEEEEFLPMAGHMAESGLSAASSPDSSFCSSHSNCSDSKAPAQRKCKVRAVRMKARSWQQCMSPRTWPRQHRQGHQRRSPQQQGKHGLKQQTHREIRGELLAVQVTSSLLPTLSFLCQGSLRRYSTHHGSFPPRFSKKKSSKGGGSTDGVAENGGSGAVGVEVSRFRLRVAALGAVLLHEDLLTPCATSFAAPAPTVGAAGATAGLARSSVQQMKATAEAFFQALGPLGNATFGSQELPLAQEAFEAAVSLSHLRLLAAAIMVEGAEHAAGGANGGDILSSQISVHRLEIVERLIDSAPSQAETVDILTFEEEAVSSSGSGEPCLRAQYRRRVTMAAGVSSGSRLRQGLHPHAGTHAEATIALGRCRCEVDVSIVDRVHALLQPQPLCAAPPGLFGAIGPQGCPAGTCDGGGEGSADTMRTRLSLHCPFLTLKVRFPTPDLRPLHDMDRAPWWKRHVRKDFLSFELTNTVFSTTFDANTPICQYELTSKEVHGLFQEADTDAPTSFARASSSEGEDTSGGGSGGDSGWAWAGAGARPRLVVTLSPEGDSEGGSALGDELSEEADSDGDTSRSPPSSTPSPFSAKRVVHESDTPHGPTPHTEEFIIPGDRQEMERLVTWSQARCRVRIDLYLPVAAVLLPTKHLYELLYNRLNADMFLWEPSAPRPAPRPAPSPAPHAHGHQPPAPHDIDGLTSPLQEAFCMCKSAVHYESESESSEEEGVFYSTYEQRQRQRRQQEEQAASGIKAFSHTALAISVGQGTLSVCAPVRASAGQVIPGQRGELLIQLQKGNLFSVSGFEGQLGLGYICLQVQELDFYHNGLVGPEQPLPVLPEVNTAPAAHLLPTVTRSAAGIRTKHSKQMRGCVPEGMLSVAIRVHMQDSVHAIKTFRVAAALREATLRHRTVPGAHSWFTQFVDFFDVNDYPIAGYDPPGVITELQLHLWGCAVDYRPLYLPLRSVLTVGSFSVASNIAAHTSTSTLRFIAEEAALFLSDKVVLGAEGKVEEVTSPLVDLQRDYVCVLDLGLFELSLRLCSQQTMAAGGSVPRVDLRASNNVLHIRTCADSAKALTELLTYFASDGDLRPSSEEVPATVDAFEGTPDPPMPTEPLIKETGIEEQLSRSQVAQVNALMEEAMQESISLHKTGVPKTPPRKGRGVEVFFFPDEAKGQKALADSELFPREEGDGESTEDNWEHDFCILDKETGSGFLPRNSLPEVRMLSCEPVRVVENHFSVPLGKTDLLKAPKGFPPAVLRYTLCEMTVIWHMFGGSDFGPAPDASQASDTRSKTTSAFKQASDEQPSSKRNLPVSAPALGARPTPCFPSDKVRRPIAGSQVTFSKASPSEVHFAYTAPRGLRDTLPQENLFSPLPPQQPLLSWQAKGGPARQHDVLMELQLNKVRFQHEVYPESSVEAARQVLLVGDLELRDRLASSDINKFLHHYASEARPRQSHANMIVVKAVHVRPDPKLSTQECSLRVSLLPLRLNIDQDALLFLCQFFSDISGRKNTSEPSTRSCAGGEAYGSGMSGGSVGSSPAHMHPVMTVHRQPEPPPPCPEPQQLLILLEDELSQAAQAPPPSSGRQHTAGASGMASQPVFFRSFVFAPDVPIRLDYQGKRVDLSHGPLAGLLMGLGQLNCSELRLKRLSHRHGLLGFDKLLAYALSEWLRDVKRHQLPWLLGGVGPLPAFLQLWSGIRDLFLLPLQQYQRDGRLARGLRRGAGAFAGSTAVAALELTQRVVAALQATAELAYDMVSPGPARRALRPLPPSMAHRRRRRHGRLARGSSGVGAGGGAGGAGDLREGVARALAVVREGLGETAHALVAAAREQHEAKGCVGAVGGVLRQLPPTALAPLLLATEATGAVLGGMRAQLQAPDARRDLRDKWRQTPDA